MGLAEDGGLLLPRTIPRVDSETFLSWQDLTYSELAFEIMSRFADDIPGSDLREIIDRSYTTFSSEEITPLVHQGNLHVLELFHGPTLAFKDVALQFLGNLFEYLLARNDSVLNILGATSGDTGSAAIYGVRGKERVNIFILHPYQRVSPVQEKQMTTVLDNNVFNIAVQGSFDDGQSIVKQIFNDVGFKKKHHLGSINSINWARILAQVVYYVRSCLHVAAHEKDSSTDFSIPTGNFGDIFAGYIAKKMLPAGTVRQLVLATNDNDILNRFISKGDYSLADVKITTSPSMDIQAASNFERYLFYLLDSDSTKTRDLMEEFAAKGKIDLSGDVDQIRRDFVSATVVQDEVKATITEFYEEFGYIIDPHTAVGIRAGQQYKTVGVPMVCLATAHPAKFSDVVTAAIGKQPDIPQQIQGIIDLPSRCELMAADKNRVKEYLESNALMA